MSKKQKEILIDRIQETMHFDLNDYTKLVEVITNINK